MHNHRLDHDFNQYFLPRYPLEVLEPVFSQYRGEVPLDHLDLPPGQLPQTRSGMAELLDRESRWLSE